jgi:GntP family gluconate:H+ symporter
MHPFLILLIGMAVVIGGVLLLRLHAFLALLLGAVVVALLTPAQAIQQYALSRGMNAQAAEQLAQSLFIDRVAEGFGKTVGQIGIVIAMASIIGDCLLRSGAADRIVRAALKLFGEKRAPEAFLASGYLLGIPVFFDTVFYLMIPLARAMRLRTGKHYLLYVLAIVAGGTMTHSLVPPTPGPLFVASQLGVNLATMIAGGCIVGAFTSLTGFMLARVADRRQDIPLRESAESMEQLQKLAGRDDSQLPSVWLSLLPILLPVVLISASAIIPSGTLLRTLGDKNVSLIIGALIAMLILLKSASGKHTEEAVKDALMSAGVIILITSAGGAFGAVLQQTNIGSALESVAANYKSAVLPVAFILTTMIRTAQGSATVAMITAAGAFAGIATPAQLGFHPLYLALVIGCGSKPFWWMNDSGFWVVTKMSGLTEKEGLRVLTPISAAMGIVGLIITMIGAKLFPLI